MTEYERGFIDGVKSKVTAELTPVITKMAGGLNQTIQEVVKTVIGNVKITAHEPYSDVKHGQWSECYTDTHHYSGICSVCGKASIKSLTESLYAFCPKCGARMDGDTNG